MSGQGVMGRDCGWCGLPAVCDVETQPAQYRTVSRRDPVSGERVTHQRLLQAAIVVPACDEHRTITAGESAPVGLPNRRKARGVEQLGLLVTADDARQRNAIYGERSRG
jgi:hypothetical protein